MLHPFARGIFAARSLTVSGDFAEAGKAPALVAGARDRGRAGARIKHVRSSA
jgi:hypothetical protein